MRWPLRRPLNLVLHRIHSHESRRSTLQLIQDEHVAFVLEKVETCDIVFTGLLEIEKMPQGWSGDLPHTIAPDPEFSLRSLKHKEPGWLTFPLDRRKFPGQT